MAGEEHPDRAFTWPVRGVAETLEMSDEPVVEGLDRARKRAARLRLWWTSTRGSEDLAQDDLLALQLDASLAEDVFDGASAADIFGAGAHQGERNYRRVGRVPREDVEADA